MILHVLNGDSTAEGLRAAGLTGESVVYADVLHEGPVPPDHDLEWWLGVRAHCLASNGWGAETEIAAELKARRRRLEGFRDYDDVVLWYEHDLFDQLLLICLLNWWWKRAPMDPPSLVSPADYLGRMGGAQLRMLLESRERVTEAQLVLAADAWQAFTAEDPRGLVRIVAHESTAVLPHLHGALRRLLEEYPSTHNGLGRTEHQMLEILAQSPLSAEELFQANARREERVFMGDSVFMLRLHRLLDGAHPLLERPLEGGTLQLTYHGEQVLRGARDDIELNDIDRWLGGVHLTRASLWRWNGAELVRA